MIPARVKIGAALLVALCAFTVFGTFMFADWDDTQAVPLAILVLAVGLGMLVGALALVLGRTWAVPVVLTLVALHLIFNLANLAIGETFVVVFVALALAVAFLVTRPTTRSAGRT